MDSFFTARADGYDEHMLTEVEGCKEGYIKMAELLTEYLNGQSAPRLLDLGCGTGLELAEIFQRIPGTKVTGVDLTRAMLDKLEEKYRGRDITLVCGSYFDVEFGPNSYDCAVSFQTMHHFTQEKKTGLYRKIFESLKSGGIYVECDYMVVNQEEEDFYFSEYRRLCREQQIGEDEFFHYDTPCTIENQIEMLKAAGFKTVKQIFRIENTTMLAAEKG